MHENRTEGFVTDMTDENASEHYESADYTWENGEATVAYRKEKITIVAKGQHFTYRLGTETSRSRFRTPKEAETAAMDHINIIKGFR